MRRVLLVLVLTVGGASGVYVATVGSTDESTDGHRFTGSTAEIVLGDLAGETTVAGTLTFSGSRTVQAGSDGIVTTLPDPGAVLTRGDRLYAVNETPTFLLSGELPAWREFASGMGPGPDVKQLEQNLRDLGHLAGEPDDRFTRATATAIRRWQESEGQPATGHLPLGSAVFADGDLRVGGISNGLGARVGPGTALYEATGTTQVVEADVRLADQQLVALDTPVTVRLPGGQDTAGVVTSVGTPTEIDGANGQKQTVIPVVVSLDEGGEAAQFQQASVTVIVPSERREDVLSVPVEALIALTPRQFGVEVVDDDGTTSKVPVTPGLFAGGRVEVSGDDIAAGRLVVVPER